MRIIVCTKQVPDTETKIKIKADGSGIDPAGIKWVINPYDEHAIEEGIKLKDSFPGSQVIVFCCGPKARVGESLRTALAMGADEGVLIDAPETADSSCVAKALAAAITKEGTFDLVLTGKLAIDDNAASVCQMLAHELNVPHVTVVSKLKVTNQSLVAEREIEGGTKEILEVTLPALIGANKGLNMPRYASLPGIMKAKKKILKEYDLAGLGLASQLNKVQYAEFRLPPEKPAAQLLQGDVNQQVSSLAKKLREEAKVL